ncbi:hypothetical protein [Thalassobaculum sp.]|uniref:hypothetical protein n=1 Tax=Thalassobaculum sp. TaxID=2022740 RepID=UPI0032EBFB3E
MVRAGHIVTCENGHPLYRVAVDIYAVPDSCPRSDDLERIDPEAQEPVKHLMIRPCPHCKAPWLGQFVKDVRSPVDRTREEPA